MKRVSLLFGFILCLTAVQAQRFVQYSADSSRIKYATFQEAETRGLTPNEFFSSFLQLDSQNRFVPSDTMYSPDSAYTYIKYRQQYGGYEVEDAMVTLTYHHHNIIRFNGYYVVANNLLLRNTFSDTDAITAFKQYYNSQNDSCDYFVSKQVAYNPLSKQSQLCYQIQSTDPRLYGKVLYISTDDLSIFKENDMPGAGFNATFCTMYNGIREGFDWGYDSTYRILKDTNAEVVVYRLRYNEYIGDIQGMNIEISNTSNYWCNNSYPQYMLDAYWSATQFSYYLQNKFQCPKHYFQRYLNSHTGAYEVENPLTPIYIATNTYEDQTFWTRILYSPDFLNREPHPSYYRNIIVVGQPGTAHNPKASIDETVHEYAHIFSYQSWEPHYSPLMYYIKDNRLAEACADIWSAVITSHIYPNEEDKIWKIGEDVVIASSGNTCIRNLANPADATAEKQMDSNVCQTEDGDAYEQSGVISHWFYLLTHGYSGTGCDDMCYYFSAIPIDTAAKLLYYCERTCFFNDMEYADICQATLDATVNFSNPESLRASILGAWNVVGVKPFSTGISQFGLSYSSLNNETYTVDKDLIIDSSRTLTIKGTIHLGDTCSIIILPGSKLILDGGTLTSACPGELWQGIEVVGDRTKRQIPQWQGTVELKNGAVIENAHCGIHTGIQGNASYATAGGIIIADSAFFINNRRAVAFLSYTNHSPAGTIMDNQSSFRRCVFTVDNNNLFSQNNADFIDHFTMWDVRGVKFLGCTFSNQTGELHQRHHAIYAEDAGFKLDSYCRSSTTILPGCECPEAYSRFNTFSGFSTAVEVLTTGVQHAVQINHALFSNNHTGVKIAGNHFTSVTRCEFDLDQVPIQSLSNRGLDLRTCTGYLVEGNTFSRSTYSDPRVFSSTGIYVDSSGVGDNTLHLNTFENLAYGIYVTRNNGNDQSGLQATCNDFDHNKYDIYMTGGSSMRSMQGWSNSGADNSFVNTQTNSFYNPGPQYISYFYSSGGSHAPYNVTPSYVALNNSATANPCSSTLCNDGWVQPRLADFQSDMDSNTGSTQPLSDTYYAAVRTIMSDTLLDLNELEQWHATAQPIGDPYSLTETRFMEGYAENFAGNAEDAEMSNYADFHALKLALRGVNDGIVGANNYSPLQTDGHINWYALTPAQIAQLQTIAERNTGRASEMAKGVLCFFHGICYEDERDNVGAFDTPQSGDDTTGTRAKHIATDNPDEAALSVYPNPTDDLLFIELRGGAEIANVALYDLQGRIVTGVFDTPQQGGTATITVKSIPAGVYVLRVTDADGKEYHQKIVRK